MRFGFVTKCFEIEGEGIEVQFKRWERKFTKSLFACFRKIRIKENDPQKVSKVDFLMDERKKLMKKKNITEDEWNKIEQLETKITEECADKEFDRLKKALGELDVGGTTNHTNVWKQMRKAFPKNSNSLPTGVKNIQGKVITNPTEKKKVTNDHFVHRMRKRATIDEVKEIRESNEKIFFERLENAKKNKSPPFTEAELDKVLKSLKNDKSKDPSGYVCELFKEGVIGTDLRESLLMMMNQMKAELKIPKSLRIANITILHKKKCRLDLNNWRGIFVCSVLRNILMKLVHERTYEKVDRNMTDLQIGARRGKSVRNHLFILNSIMSDVLSSVKKESIDLNIMDYKQMFDSEELSTCLNAMYEADIKDDMLALIYEANETTYFKLKTPNGLTEIETMKNKILQGDVLAPMLSSNMVDKNIGNEAIKSENVYLYKDKVVIPPLMMQYDTLGITQCGFKGRKMNNFLNTRTNIMGLQYGTNKCEKMHIGKREKNEDVCVKFDVDSWEDKVVQNLQGVEKLVDTYTGKKTMKCVTEKKYLGDIISCEGSNKLNIKDKTNKGVGNVNKILASINERPYGKHTFAAASLMRQGMLLGSMLPNAESWINITETDLTNLQKPDTMLQRELLSVSGNPSKAFMSLELGFVPVKYVIMYKRLTFLHYILNENTTSTLKQVYDVLKCDSRRGDFYCLVQKDMKDTEITQNEEEIKQFKEEKWKEYVKHKVTKLALKMLVNENLTKEKTMHIQFDQIKMSDYLIHNENSRLSKIIFAIRSGTFDIKVWHEWKYDDNACIGCKLNEENMDHFMVCSSYENCTESRDWKLIFENNPVKQFEIAHIAQKRMKLRLKIMENQVAGPTLQSGSDAPGIC